jgi:hypothetical protein
VKNGPIHNVLNTLIPRSFHEPINYRAPCGDCGGRMLTLRQRTIVLLVFLYASPAYTQASRNEGELSRRVGQPVASQQSAAAQSHSTEKAFSATSTEQDGQEHTHNERWTMRATVALAVLTLGLAIGTGVLACYTYGLWNTTKTMVEETKDTGQRELRAYVGVEPDGIKDEILSIVSPCKIRFKNYGQTPALCVRVTMSRRVLRGPLPDDEPLHPQVDPDPIHERLLEPSENRGSISGGRLPALTVEELRMLSAGQDSEGHFVRLYCYGTVEYRDVFGKNHWTRFCHYYGDDNQFTKETAAYCHRHNDSSDNATSAEEEASIA